MDDENNDSSDECGNDRSRIGEGGERLRQNNDEEEYQTSIKKKKKAYKLSLTETENFNEKLNKRGVVYVARIPPKMTPTKMKALLSEFGPVSRIYLVEEDPSVRKRRRKELGRSGGKRYLEGWVEFVSKKTAKHVAAALNTTPITNHKRNPHYGEWIV
jgi:ESF2/ABP1 family protein